MMVEPMPGTQTIYEYLSDCPTEFTSVSKVYPPNSTVIVNNACPNLWWYVLGEVTKLVVEHNDGSI